MSCPRKNRIRDWKYSRSAKRMLLALTPSANDCGGKEGGCEERRVCA